MSETPNPPQEPGNPNPDAAPQNPGAAPPAPAAGSAPNSQTGAPAPVASYAAPATTDAPDAADVEKNKVMAALSYVGILWLVPLLAAKDSPYAKFHCNQGILLSIGTFGLCIVLTIMSFVLAFIPGVNIVAGCLSCVVWPLVMVAILAFMILGIVNAIGGKQKTLPLFPRVNWVK